MKSLNQYGEQSDLAEGMLSYIRDTLKSNWEYQKSAYKILPPDK